MLFFFLLYLWHWLEAERSVEADGWAWNGNCNVCYWLLHQKVAASYRLEPHVICLVIAHFVNIYAASSIREIGYDNAFRHYNFFVTV